ncbi:basic proline-rich protein-like [Corvus moneduloides]|uniref:basic proline-rich protein-like n=1 Tax=Corvus moneduloides TaxID=1196302 RepID=UPI0013621FCF|nr:basic proline-rich protein-like [Corvus moneduloides]
MVYLDRSRDRWEEQHLKPTTKVNTRTAAPTYTHRVSGTQPGQESPPQPPPLGPAEPADERPDPLPRQPRGAAPLFGVPPLLRPALRRYGRRRPPPRRLGDPHPPPAATGGQIPPRPHCPLPAVPRARAGCGRRSPRSTPVTFRERPPGPRRRFGAPPVCPHTPGWGRQAHTAGRGRRDGSRTPTPVPGRRRAAGAEPPEAPARTPPSPTPESSPGAGQAGSLRSLRPRPQQRRRPHPGPARAPPAHLPRRRNS